MKKLLSIVLVLATAGTACAATQSHSSAPRQLRVPLQIGGVVPELLDPSLQDLTIGLMKQANLADVGRITVTWQKGQTAMDPGQLGDLRTGVDKATAAGIDVYLDVYPNGSSQTPNSAADQADFATWAASVVARPAGPEARDRRQRVEPQPLLAAAVRARQAGPRRDRLHEAAREDLRRGQGGAPTVEVVGGALAHSGTDKRPSTGRETHSPAQFILDMGTAYRA